MECVTCVCAWLGAVLGDMIGFALYLFWRNMGSVF